MTSTRNLVLTALILVFGTSAFAEFAEDNTWANMFGYQTNGTVSEAPGTTRTVRTKRKAKPAPKKTVTRKVTRKKETKKTVVASKPKSNTIAKKPAPQAPEANEVQAQPAKAGKIEVSNEALQGQLARFKHVDPKNLVAEEPLKRALSFYAMNQHKVSNSRYLGVIDFSINSAKPRFCIINMKSGETECLKTSHGVGSDGGGGWAKKFSNKSNSHASSVGYYKTLATYSGKHGTSLRLDGLSATNSNALNRAVVIHGAWYVKDGNRATAGRSHGCPAVDDSRVSQVISKLKGGAVIYAWHPKHMSEPSR